MKLNSVYPIVLRSAKSVQNLASGGRPGVLLVALLLVTCRIAMADAPADAALLRETFDGPDRLLTNEYARWNPDHADAVKSAVWDMTSGSLFVRDGAAWSGVPNDISPDAQSKIGNDSAVFRLTTKREDFQNVAISLRLKNNGLSSTKRTPLVAWDGIHIFLRYQSEESLYYASVNRRDNLAVIKKKVPGGPSNGGTYFQLAQAPHVVRYNEWQNLRATVQTLDNKTVLLRVFDGDVLVVQAIDKGEHGAPLLQGATGIRGDNCDFLFDDFTVTPLH